MSEEVYKFNNGTFEKTEGKPTIDKEGAKRLLTASLYLRMMEGKEPELAKYYNEQLEKEKAEREERERKGHDINITDDAIKKVNGVMEDFSEDEKYMLRHFLNKELDEMPISTTEAMELEKRSKHLITEEARVIHERLTAKEELEKLVSEGRVSKLKPFLNEDAIKFLADRLLLESYNTGGE